MKTWRYFNSFGLAVLLACGSAGCSDDDAASSKEDQEQENQENNNNSENQNQNENENENENENQETEEPVNPGQEWKALLLPNIPTEIDVAYNGKMKLSVMLVSTVGDQAGEGMIDELISWGIETGKESIMLDSRTSKTAEGGIAYVPIKSKQVTGDAVIVASSRKAPKDVRFNLHVLDIPTGSLSIGTKYNGSAPIANYSIRLYNAADLKCADFDPETGVSAEPIVDPVDSPTAEFENLSIKDKFSVVAYGYTEKGALAAAGCLDSGLEIIENQATKGNVYLDTIELDLSTTYHIRSYFDLGDVASALGDVGKFIVTVSDFADNPGDMLMSAIKSAIKTGIGGFTATLVNLVLGLVDEKLSAYINELVLKNNITKTVGMFACQFRNIIRMMEFVGELDVMRSGQVSLEGENRYDGLAAYWRIGQKTRADGTKYWTDKCDRDKDGNYIDPNCGRMMLTTKQLNLGQTLNFLEGSWDGSVANGYDKLSIEAHELKLYYGEIIVYLINHVLLPKIADGATSFDQAISNWINCNSVGKTIHGWLPNWDWVQEKISVETTTGWCHSASKGLATLLGFATAFTELQKAGSDINISGTATFNDSNVDNVIDDIKDGKWSGSMTITQKSSDANGIETEVKKTTGVKGIWSAYNMKNVKTEGGAIYCTYPKTKTDSDDQICSYPRIDANSLLPASMCDKYTN